MVNAKFLHLKKIIVYKIVPWQIAKQLDWLAVQLISVILLDNGLGNLLKQRQNFEMAQLTLSGFGVGFMDYMTLGQTEGLTIMYVKNLYVSE